MPETFTFEEAAQPETFSFEEASAPAPESFSFEEAQRSPSPETQFRQQVGIAGALPRDPLERAAQNAQIESQASPWIRALPPGPELIEPGWGQPPGPVTIRGGLPVMDFIGKPLVQLWKPDPVHVAQVVRGVTGLEGETLQKASEEGLTDAEVGLSAPGLTDAEVGLDASPFSRIKLSPYEQAKLDGVDTGPWSDTPAARSERMLEAARITSALPALFGKAVDLMGKGVVGVANIGTRLANLTRPPGSEILLLQDQLRPQIPKLEDDSVSSGVINAAIDMANNLVPVLAPPEVGLTLPLAGARGPVGEIMGTLYGGAMAQAVPGQVISALDVASSPAANRREKAEAIAAPILNTLMAGSMLKHGMAEPVEPLQGPPATGEVLRMPAGARPGEQPVIRVPAQETSEPAPPPVAAAAAAVPAPSPAEQVADLFAGTPEPAKPAVPQSGNPAGPVAAPPVEAPQVEAPQVEAPQVEAPQVEAPAKPATLEQNLADLHAVISDLRDTLTRNQVTKGEPPAVATAPERALSPPESPRATQSKASKPDPLGLTEKTNEPNRTRQPGSLPGQSETPARPGQELQGSHGGGNRTERQSASAQGQAEETATVAQEKSRGSASEGADMPFSLGDELDPGAGGKSETAMPSAAMDSAVRDWRKGVANAPEVEIVDRPDWTHTGNDGRKRIVEGQWNGQKIIINRAGIRDAERLRSVLEHEHAHGLLSGADGQAALDAVTRQKLGEEGQAGLRQKYAQRPGESTQAYDRRLREEWLARLAEKKAPVWRQIVRAVKAWLAKRGLLRLTDEDVGRQILRSLKKGADAAQTSARESLRDEYFPTEKEQAAADAQAKGLGPTEERPQPPPRPGATPPERDLFARARRFGQQLWNNVLTGNPRDIITRTKDAADTGAVLFGNQGGNVVLHALNRAFESGVDARNELREQALTFAIEAGANPENLREARELVAGSDYSGSKWGKTALKAIAYAEEHLSQLQPVADLYRRITDQQVSAENAQGIATLHRNQGYVFHQQDVSGSWGLPDEAGGGGVGSPFRHIRDHATYADAIASGVMPENLSAIDLLKTRLTLGRRLIAYRLWLKGMFNMADPNSGLAVAVKPDVRPRADGTADVTAPPGYSLQSFSGMQLAVLNGYNGLFRALTDDSHLRIGTGWPAMLNAMTASKHVTLLFDTFHLGRLAFWNSMVRGIHSSPAGGLLPGLPTFKRGVTLLDNTPGQLRLMAQRGEIPREWLSGLEDAKAKLELLRKAGLNTGTIADNLHKGWVEKLPVTGRFNRWLFQQYQRGAMAEASLIEFARQRRMFERTETPEQTAARVALDLNKRFGQLGSKSFIKRKTMADIARIVFLAPFWNEGLIRSEASALGQVLRAPMDSYRNRRLAVGTLGRATAVAFLGQFIANQVINYITRGKPTWENEEDTPGAKLSAWVPDVVGGGPGFFLNPVALPLEITHLIHGWAERRGGDYSMALRQFVAGRLNSASRALWVGATREAPLGGKLRTGTEVGKEMLKAAIPTPIGASGYVRAAKQLVSGENEEQFPGQIQKQVMQSFGIKADQAPSAEQRVRILAAEFQRRQPNYKPNPEFYASDYWDLKNELRMGNMTDARKALEDLRQKKTDAQILAYFKQFDRQPFSGSMAKEGAFLRELTPEQRQTYQRARVEQRTQRQRFYQLWRQVKAAVVSTQAVRARTWISSSDGQSRIKQALIRAKETTLRLQNARLVSQESLHEPITK